MYIVVNYKLIPENVLHANTKTNNNKITKSGLLDSSVKVYSILPIRVSIIVHYICFFLLQIIFC